MIEWTRVRLTQWGRHCRGVTRTGYPTASAFVRANEGDRSRYDGADMPADIQEIEDVVRRMSGSLALPIHAKYIWSGPYWFRALRLGISECTFRRRCAHAEEWIDRQLVVLAERPLRMTA
ncbi:MAG: hypothetical protein IT178_16520 [Acidobacteria bacterium]|nr:hypothetical protein [Acidobacteriota bacterium]